MTGAKRIAVILLCAGFSAFLNYALRRGPGGTIHTVDLAEIYYGDRCALQHQDPYDPATVLHRFSAEGGKFPKDMPGKPIAALTMLPVYHRPYDAKLLLLTLPACAMLWAAKAPRRWLALVLTAAAIVVTSDIPLAIDAAIGQSLSLSANTIAGKVATVLLLRPAPVILLALGCFYLWVLLRYQPPASILPRKDEASTSSAVSTAT